MPPTVLDEHYWNEQFLLPEATVDDLLEFLRAKGSAHTKELAEEAVRDVLEQQIHVRGFRVYSPEQAYHRGEVIFFQGNAEPRFAEVLDIDPGRSAPLGDRRIDFTALTVRFRDDPYRLRTFVSNCASMPLRFTDTFMTSEGSYVTPASIVTRFGDQIIGALKPRLIEDGRFLECMDHWALVEHSVSLSEEHQLCVLGQLRTCGQAVCSDLAKLLFPSVQDEKRLRSLAVSVGANLKDDQFTRFALVSHTEELLATLSPPPKQLVVTLTMENIREGFLPVSRQFRKMIDFFGFGPILTFKVYGDYEVRAAMDDDGTRLSSTELGQWMAENGLVPGNKVYVGAPDSPKEFPRLSTLLESSGPPPLTGTSEPRSDSRKFLRHRIYLLLQERSEFLHYREITNCLNADGVEVQANSVEAILSLNSHVFARRDPSRGIWGLRSWLEKGSQEVVSATSLLLAIGEEKWVRRVLERASVPLTAGQITKELSDIFRVRVDQVRGLTFLDPSDTELVRLKDDRWALKEWRLLWTNRVRACDEALFRIRAHEKEIEGLQKRIEEISIQLANLLKAIEDLSRIRQKAEREITGHETNIERILRRKGGLQPILADKTNLLDRKSKLEARLRRAISYCAVVGLILGSLGYWGQFPTFSAVAVASVILLVAAGIWALRTRERVGLLRREQGSLQAELSSLEREQSLTALELESIKQRHVQFLARSEELMASKCGFETCQAELENQLSKAQSEITPGKTQEIVKERAEFRALLALME